VKCSQCAAKTKWKIKFRASVLDTLGTLIISLFILLPIYLVTKLVSIAVVSLFILYIDNQVEHFIFSILLIKAISYLFTLYLVYVWFIAKRVTRLLNFLSYFINYQLSISEVCQSCTTIGKQWQFPNDLDDQ